MHPGRLENLSDVAYFSQLAANQTPLGRCGLQTDTQCSDTPSTRIIFSLGRSDLSLRFQKQIKDFRNKRGLSEGSFLSLTCEMSGLGEKKYFSPFSWIVRLGKGYCEHIGHFFFRNIIVFYIKNSLSPFFTFQVVLVSLGTEY